MRIKEWKELTPFEQGYVQGVFIAYATSAVIAVLYWIFT